MKEPIYKPEQWVMYKQGDDGGFGQIVGARYHSDSWHYSVKGANLDTTFVSVCEDEVTHFNESNSWLEPQHAGVGGPSVYTQ